MMLLICFLLLFVGSFAKAQVPDLHVNQQDFADELTEALYKNVNDCTSSLGVSMALSLVYPSATGDAKIQLQDVLGYPEDSDQLVWSTTTKQLVGSYSGTCLDWDDRCSWAEPLLSISNSVWVDSSSTLDPAYATVVEDLLFPIDFAAETAGSEVNAWVNEKTNGLIDSIVEDKTLIPLILLAVNAIYLKANWLTPFSSFLTNEDVFYTAASRMTTQNEQVHFMHQVEYFSYSHEAIPGYQIVKLPFLDDSFLSSLSFVVVLPTSDNNPMVTSTDLIDALPNLRNQRIALALPKFELESTYKDTLKESLQDLGLIAPFMTGLCIYENDCSAFIDFIIQKTFISVDEEGVEAAAVTAVGVDGSGIPVDMPILFLADHPFQFFIYEEESELALFEGLIGNPEPQDSSIAELTAQHGNANFWINSFGLESEPFVPDSIDVTKRPSMTKAPTQTPTPAPDSSPLTSSSTNTTSTSSSVRWGDGAMMTALLGVLFAFFYV